MSEPSREFEEQLRRVQPRRVSSALQEAVGRRLDSSAPARDWPMLCAVSSGLAAACVIVAMLMEQSPARSPKSNAPHALVASTPEDPPEVYAFYFAKNSLLDENRRVR